MRKLLLVLAGVLTLAVFVPAAPASAAPPDARVRIIAEENLPIEADGTFVAHGKAVNADGLLCGSGTVHTEYDGPITEVSPGVLEFTVIKTFICDGSGDTLVVTLDVTLYEASGFTTGSWMVTGGSLDIDGSGSLIGIPNTGGITDHYFGRLSSS